MLNHVGNAGAGADARRLLDDERHVDGFVVEKQSMRRFAVAAIVSFVAVENEMPSTFPGNKRSMVSKIGRPIPVLSMQRRCTRGMMLATRAVWSGVGTFSITRMARVWVTSPTSSLNHTTERSRLRATSHPAYSP